MISPCIKIGIQKQHDGILCSDVFLENLSLVNTKLLNNKDNYYYILDTEGNYIYHSKHKNLNFIPTII